jgi:hypothetical protein
LTFFQAPVTLCSVLPGISCDTWECVYFQCWLVIPSHFTSHLFPSPTSTPWQAWKVFQETRALCISCVLSHHPGDSQPPDSTLSFLDHRDNHSVVLLERTKAVSLTAWCFVVKKIYVRMHSNWFSHQPCEVGWNVFYRGSCGICYSLSSLHLVTWKGGRMTMCFSSMSTCTAIFSNACHLSVGKEKFSQPLFGVISLI